jgi:hypothetical protein
VTTDDPDDLDPQKYKRYFSAPKSDMPVVERDAARTFLKAARFSVERLISRQRGQDPPDCEAIVDGVRAGIEVTELVDPNTLNRTLKGKREYLVWDQRLLVERIQQRISDKAGKSFKGGPYDRKMLIIYTDEFDLQRDKAKRLLAGQCFAINVFSNVVLGFSYHPHHRKLRPAFRLKLARPDARRG